MDSIVKLDELVPDFTLSDLDDNAHTLSDWRGKIVILNFWSAECPWSLRADEAMASAGEEWGENVLLWSVASNKNESRAELKKSAAERGLQTVLLDSDNVVADLFEAVTTPHFFVIDEQGFLRYKGALDDVTFRQRTASRSYLLDAISAMMSGNRPDFPESAGYGCSIVRDFAGDALLASP